MARKKQSNETYDGGSELYTLAELVEQLRAALTAAGQSFGDRRVARFPDARTIRYYHSLGLVDPPAAYRGAQALYGTRHLLQVAAVKALQGQYLPLAKVQERLLGLGDDALAEIAAAVLGPGDGPAGPTPRRRLSAEKFWQTEPEDRPPASWHASKEIEIAPGMTLRIRAGVTVPDHPQGVAKIVEKVKAALLAYRDVHGGRPEPEGTQEGGSDG